MAKGLFQIHATLAYYLEYTFLFFYFYSMNDLDRFDYAILGALQTDGTLSVAELAEKVGLTTTPCWKRLKRLEEEGYIDGRVALVNRSKAALPVTVFVSVRTSQHDEKWLAKFAAGVIALPEVQEFHRMSGDIDYLLKVVTTDIEGYDRFYKKLIKVANLTGVSSAFSMEQIKYTTALPLHLVSHSPA